jgi:hypothetical protein
MDEELVRRLNDEIEIIELDSRLDMAIDPLAINPLVNTSGCGHGCGFTCTNNTCVGWICGVSCC